MTVIDDLLYSPILPTVPKEELRDLVKKIMSNPTDRKIMDAVSDSIVDLFHRHGIHNEQVIVDEVYRNIQDIERDLAVIGLRIRAQMRP